MTIYATLCFIVKDGRVLLLKKAEGLWGGGKWNGPGGKLHPGENPQQGAIREMFEETGLTVEDPEQQGVLYFFFGREAEPDWVVYVFRAEAFSGEMRESEEGILRWHPVEHLPYEQMWEDDRHWLPVLLSGQRFKGGFYFDEEVEELLAYRLDTFER